MYILRNNRNRSRRENIDVKKRNQEKNILRSKYGMES